MSAVDLLAPLEPSGIWRRFAELTEIPRPPKEEEHARAYVLEWAAGLGLESAVDDEGNVVVRVPASTGREDAPTVVLQSHLDMVCEREPWSELDPRAGRIRVELDDGWVIAPETTLGADNGIGVAAAMAVAEDVSIEHGPLELLFTVSEEQGLDGAKALDPSLVSGRLLLNLDGTSDHSLTIGCAGSTHTFSRLALGLGSRRRRRAARRGLRRAWRPLGRRHPQGPRERDQGARPRARPRARALAVSACDLRGRREQERDPARGGGCRRGRRRR